MPGDVLVRAPTPCLLKSAGRMIEVGGKYRYAMLWPRLLDILRAYGVPSVASLSPHTKKVVTEDIRFVDGVHDVCCLYYDTAEFGAK
jgi:hypothetical protein